MRRTRLKICGIFRKEDIVPINEARPDYAGFVFYEKSHRHVTEEEAMNLRKLLDPAVVTVGVFVDELPEKVEAVYKSGTISIIQLHGHESEEYIRTIREILPEAEIWKAFKITSEADLADAEKSTADMVMLDNGYGTGQRFDWDLIGDMKRPFILAGGLTPENTGEAVRRFGPAVVDISSGVETDRVKDPDKIRAAAAAAGR